MAEMQTDAVAVNINTQSKARSEDVWRHDLDMALRDGAFSIIIHGVMGAGKSKLIEYLCGLPSESIAGVKNSGTGGFTTERKRYKFVGKRGRYMNIIDTPGFGETDKDRQRMVLEGIDNALGQAREYDLPLRRIYFMLDWAKDADQVPHTLVRNLLALALGYRKANLVNIKFVVSKFDRISSELSQSVIDRNIEAVIVAGQEIGLKLSRNSVLFISAGDRSASESIRPLTQDIVNSTTQDALDIEPQRMSTDAGSYAKPLFDLHKVASDHAKERDMDFPEWKPIYSIVELLERRKSVLEEVNVLGSHLKKNCEILDNKVKDSKTTNRAIGTLGLALLSPVAGISLVVATKAKNAWHESKKEDDDKALKEITNLKKEVEFDLCDLAQ